MPSGFATLDTSFPKLEGMSDEQRIQTLTSYLYHLLENLRYVLNNLGEENINENDWKKITNAAVFTALGQEGATIINGANISTGSINADLITTGELNGVNIRGVKIYGVDVYGAQYHDSENGNMVMQLRPSEDGGSFILGNGALGNVMFDVSCSVSEIGGVPVLRTELRFNGVTILENEESAAGGVSADDIHAQGDWIFDSDIQLPAGSQYPNRTEVQAMIDASIAAAMGGA